MDSGHAKRMGMRVGSVTVWNREPIRESVRVGRLKKAVHGQLAGSSVNNKSNILECSQNVSTE